MSPSGCRGRRAGRRCRSRLRPRRERRGRGRTSPRAPTAARRPRAPRAAPRCARRAPPRRGASASSACRRRGRRTDRRQTSRRCPGHASSSPRRARRGARQPLCLRTPRRSRWDGTHAGGTRRRPPCRCGRPPRCRRRSRRARRGRARRAARRPPARTGPVTVVTWLTESECVSSKSRPWQSIAFAKAAFGPGRRVLQPDDGRVRLAAELGHRRPALAGDAGRVRGEPAPERVENVQLRRVGDLLRHVVEGQRRRPGGDALRGCGHRKPPLPAPQAPTRQSSSVTGNVPDTSGASRL